MGDAERLPAAATVSDTGPGLSREVLPANMYLHALRQLEVAWTSADEAAKRVVTADTLKVIFRANIQTLLPGFISGKDERFASAIETLTRRALTFAALVAGSDHLAALTDKEIESRAVEIARIRDQLLCDLRAAFNKCSTSMSELFPAKRKQRLE